MTKPHICPFCGDVFDDATVEDGYVSYNHKNDDGTWDTCGEFIGKVR